MWFVDLGEGVWADTARGDLQMFRYVGPFPSWQVAKDFCGRYPFIKNAQYHYIESVADFEASTVRVK